MRNIQEEVKQLRNNKKTAKKMFKKACKENSQKEKALDIYVKAQISLKNKIQDEQKHQTEQKIKTLISEGGTKSNTFWKIRKKLLNSKSNEQSDLTTEENTHIPCPEEAKEYIANYFESLYQAREGENEYQKWTQTIQESIQNAEKNTEYSKNIPISEKEVMQAIKSLKRNKSSGPDNIPNEIFINANNKTSTKITEILNNIHMTQNIPEQWQHGEIITFYKRKGAKGKCSNQRGITLASNFGKLYERIIDKRAKNKLMISEAQAGGQKGKSTSDHIRAHNDLITLGRESKKPVYVTYLDVTKAYDKAWLDAILYVLLKQGLTDPTWTAIKNLNKNLTAEIKTKYGPTRPIKIKDSIRQGGVLSVIMYAILMDEIAKAIKQENLGIPLPNSSSKQGCLLWMDDVALISNDKKTMQKMLNITNEIACRYRIKF